MPKLSDAALDLLAVMVTCNSYYVSSENIVEAGALIQRGFASAQDDCEGPQLFPTEQGRKFLLRKKLIKPDPGAVFAPFSRTPAGDALRQS